MGESLTTTVEKSMMTARESLSTVSTSLTGLGQSLTTAGKENKLSEADPPIIYEPTSEETRKELAERKSEERAEQKRLATENTRKFLKHAIRGIDISLLDDNAFGGKTDAILTIDSQLTTISIARVDRMSHYKLCDIENIHEGAEACRNLNSVLPDVAFYIRDSERERVVRLVHKRDNKSEMVWFIYSSEIFEGAVKTALEILQMCAVVIPEKYPEGEAEVSESTAEPKS